MLESLISATDGSSFTLANAAIIIVASIILGLAISCIYMQIHKKEGYSSGFVLTLVMLPVIISIIILLVGNNVARAFSLAGAFSIIRFRSTPGNPKDIAYVFFTLAVGLACGMGYVGYAVIFTIVLCIVILVLDKINYGSQNSKVMQLKITIPEDLNYEGIFESILDNYTNSYHIQRVRTRDFGALFELFYIVNLKNDVSQKKFIDELRCKNGNLSISLTLAGLDKE